MVFTRNQKRQRDFDADDSDSDSNKKKMMDSMDDSCMIEDSNEDTDKIEDTEESDEMEDTDETDGMEESDETEESDEADKMEDTEETDESDEMEESDEAGEVEETEESENLTEEMKTLIQRTVKKIVAKVTVQPDANQAEEPADCYDEFLSHVESIYNGDFFERVPVEEKKRSLKKAIPPEELERFNTELKQLRDSYKETAPSIVDILKMEAHSTYKQKLLEKIHHYSNSDVLTQEYNSNLKYLLTNINKTQDQDLFQLEQDIMKSAQSDELSDDYRRKILKSKMTFENKVIAYKRLEIMERYEDSDSSEFSKYKNWMDILLAVPFGKYIQTPYLEEVGQDAVKEYIGNVRTVLDKRLSFLEKPKDQIINIVSQMVRNKETSINAIGLWGSKGTGKTSIVKSIAEALGRPYRVITLGGESDTSLLTGHGFTYVGSSPGRLIEILNETKTMNPVVLIDELDKVSQTHHGKEIIGTLIHLTDQTTNNKYNYDRYFAGVEFDLSKVLFVFTYNDPSKVDRILADRLFKIKVDNYTFKEKLEIVYKHLIDDVLEAYNFTREQIGFAEDAIHYIINQSSNDEGMRNIKRKFEIIVSRINTLSLTKPDDNIVKLKYQSLYPYYHAFPCQVLKEHVDILLAESSSNDVSEVGPPEHMYI
jgi:ATP-dependent Lon protease